MIAAEEFDGPPPFSPGVLRHMHSDEYAAMNGSFDGEVASYTNDPSSRGGAGAAGAAAGRGEAETYSQRNSTTPTVAGPPVIPAEDKVMLGAVVVCALTPGQASNSRWAYHATRAQNAGAVAVVIGGRPDTTGWATQVAQSRSWLSTTTALDCDPSSELELTIPIIRIDDSLCAGLIDRLSAAGRAIGKVPERPQVTLDIRPLQHNRWYAHKKLVKVLWHRLSRMEYRTDQPEWEKTGPRKLYRRSLVALGESWLTAAISMENPCCSCK